MDAMLQRHCARYIYVVPDGLRELMSDISREVIRSQPEFIYTFIADYIDALMITRENARVAARMVQSITEISVNIIELLIHIGMARSNAEKLANIMQEAFRKYIDVKVGDKAPDISEEDIIQEIMENTGISMEEADKAATVIQQGYRNFKEKKDREKELLTGMIDWRVAARSAIYLYRRTGVSADEANRAATMIKAAYKGYYTRKFMKRLAEEAAHIFDVGEEHSDTTLSSEDNSESKVHDLEEIPELPADTQSDVGAKEDTDEKDAIDEPIEIDPLDDIQDIMSEILDAVITEVGERRPGRDTSVDLLVAANRVSGRDIKTHGN